MDPCMICGGDGRISNSFGGSTATCPACHGTGRRGEDGGFRDVTKTKPEHHNPAAAKKSANTGSPHMVSSISVLTASVPWTP